MTSCIKTQEAFTKMIFDRKIFEYSTCDICKNTTLHSKTFNHCEFLICNFLYSLWTQEVNGRGYFHRHFEVTTVKWFSALCLFFEKLLDMFWLGGA